MENTELIIRDSFTERLLEVFEVLVKKDAIRYKKDFAKAAELTLIYFYHIEKQTRNYPNDELRRSQTRINLHDKYGVNPSFLSGASKTMFTREPEKAKRTSGGGAVTKIVSFKQLKQKDQTIEGLMERILVLESLIVKWSEDPVAYSAKIKSEAKRIQKNESR